MKLKKTLSALLIMAMLFANAGFALPAAAEETTSEAPAPREEKHEEPKQEEKREEPKPEPPQEEPKQEEKPAETQNSDPTEAPKDDPTEPVNDDPTETPKADEPTEVPGETIEPDDGKGQTTPEPSDAPGEGETPLPTEGEATPEPSESPEPSETPEPTETPEPVEPAEIHSLSASTGTAIVGKQVTFHFSVSNATALKYRLYAPGGTGTSGTLSADASSYAFTPEREGTYTFELTAVAADDSEVFQRVAVEAVIPPELTLTVSADRPSGFAGDTSTFTLSLSEGVELANCDITVTHNGSTVYHSSTFSETVSATAARINRVANMTITVSVTDIYGQTVTQSVTIPCAVHDDESRSQWERTLRGVAKTGVWPEDVVAIARSQIGYRESEIDFEVKEDGRRQGYTRYGDWAGMPYEEWCAMFACFCLHYAGISESDFPRASNCQRWIKALRKVGLYAPRGTYDPKVGDLVIFDYEADDDADHVGIICDVAKDSYGIPVRVTTIEGNHKASVATGMTYSVTDGRIVGYGLVNKAYERDIEKHYRRMVVEDEGYVVTAGIDADAKVPAHAIMIVREIPLESKEFDRLVEDTRAFLEDEAAGTLSFARYFEILFQNEDGTLVTPAAAIDYEIDFPERFSNGGKLKPAVVNADVMGRMTLNPEAEVVRCTVNGVSGRGFTFAQEGAPDVIGVIVAGDVKLRTAKNEKLRFKGEDFSLALSCDEDAGIPQEAVMTAEAITPDDPEYADCAAALAQALGDVDPARARILRVELSLNGLKIVPTGAVTLEYSVGGKAEGARVAALDAGEALEAEFKQTKSRAAVTFVADTLDAFAVVFDDEAE